MPRGRGRPEAVDRSTLISTTMRIIDSEGVEALTMRRLAVELGVSPMAPYRHVRSKVELLRIVAADVVSNIHIEPTGSWADDLLSFFDVFHQRLLGYPGVSSLYAGQAFLSDEVYEVSEPIIAVLLEAGFPPATAVSLFMACAATTIGSAALQSAEEQQRDADSAPTPDPDRFPATAAIFHHLPNHHPVERHAEAIRAILNGYAPLATSS